MRDLGIPVLMYHALVAQPQPGTNPVHIAVRLFEQHLAWLHAQGYEVITVAELYNRLIEKSIENKLSDCVVVLTFDDGYQSLVAHAAPILKKYGFVATLFLTTDFVGMSEFPGAFAHAVPLGDRPLTWSEIQALQSSGWDIQAHSCSHRFHAALPTAQLQVEFEGSKHLIYNKINKNSEFYAFPYGSYDGRALRVLLDTGYRAGFSVHGGPARSGSDLRRLPRIEVNTNCTLPVFEKLVRTGYASAAEKYRARLRDALFYFPAVKDALHKVFAGVIN